MATRPGIKIRYKPVRSYSVWQGTFPGAQSETGKRGWWPQVAEPSGGISPAVDHAVKMGGRLFISGDFTTISAVSRDGFAALEISTGALVSGAWNPVFTSGTAQGLGTDGTYLYVGGDFTAVNDGQGSGDVSTINGLPVRGLVRFDYDGNLDTTWNPSPNANPDIDVIVWNPDRASLYVAGNGLTSIGGQSRDFVAEILVSDGTATSWNPDPDTTVRAIALDTDRDLVYLGGSFLNLGATPRDRLARVDYAGTVDSWDPAPDGDVWTIMLDGLRVYVGGAFANIGVTPVARSRAALLDDEGEALTWNPAPNLTVKTLAKLGNLVFMGGLFTTVLAVARDGLAAVHDGDSWRATADDLDDWNPDLDVADVRAMVLLDKTVYAGGAFTTSAYAAGQGLFSAFPWPIFTDANTRYVSKAGSDSAAGTFAAPFLTIGFALTTISGAFRFVVVKDSGTYDERLTVSFINEKPLGLFALDGQAPTLSMRRGVVAGTYGARRTGRTKFSTGLPATFYYVSKDGDDATGARGNPSKPFETISAALANGARLANDTIQIEDDGVYTEDIDPAALAVTIQARDGKVPTLRNGGGTIHVDADAAAVNLYGLNFADTVKASGQIIRAQKNVSCWDCTFAHNAFGIYGQTGAAGTLALEVVNCAFYYTDRSAIYVDYKTTNLTVTNTYFEGCNGNKSGSTPAPKGGVVVYTNATTGGALTWVLSRCTFRNNYSSCLLMSNGDPAGTGTTSGSAKFLSCDVIYEEAPADLVRGVSLFMIFAAPSWNYEVDNCYFFQCSAQAVLDTASNLGAAGTGKITNCVAQRCGFRWFTVPSGVTGAGAKFGFAGPSPRTAAFQQGPFSIGAGVSPKGPNQAYMKNCVALETGDNGFFVCLNTPAGSALVENCVSVNAQGGYGFLILLPTGKSVTVKDCSETAGPPNANPGMAAGGNPDLGTGTIAWQGCVTGKGFSGGIVLAGNVLSEPKYLSTRALEENVGLSASSLAINAATSKGNAGIHRSILTIDALGDPFWVDGLTFSGDVNFDNGLEVDRDLDSYAEVWQCSFEGLAVEALRLGSGSRARSCYLRPNGTGIMLADAGDRIERCVIDQADGAGVFNDEAAAAVAHATVYGSEFGLFERATALGPSYEANVLAGSATLDYRGEDDQVASVVPNVSDGAEVTEGSRGNPLFRNLDPGVEDLRIQAVPVGFFFDSPARGLAPDGTDAGAYDFYYGPLSLSWTELDFGAPGWQNPHFLERRLTPVKPREGTFVDGDSYSAAQDVRREWELTWPDDAVMPDAQGAALQDLYSTGEGEAQIDFGDGWIPVRRLQSDAGITRRETARLPYAEDEVDTPIRSMTFRESD